MKRYCLLPCCVIAMLLFGACVITPLAPAATPTPQPPLQPTFTPTAAVTATAPITATAVITIAITPTGTVTTTSGTGSIAPVTTPVTGTAPLTVTPVLTPTAVVTNAATTAPAAATPAPASQGGTIAAIVAARPDFATLNRAIQTVQLTTTLNGGTPYTLLAPTESAFAALPTGTLNALLASPGALARVLQNHLLLETIPSAQLVRLGRVQTVLGQTLPITLTAAGIVQVGNAVIVEPDIAATNGVIHAIDTVLLPANLVITPTTGTTGTAGVSAAAQVTTTQAITTAKIITTVAPTATIADVVRTTPALSTLATALGAAGLLQALQLPGNLTLFAPTNDAFAALPAGQLQPLLNNTTAIANVLQYHLVADRVLASDLVRLGRALSTTGQPLRVTVAANGVIQVNTARVIQTDIVTTNGVIHLIDAVLTPPAQ